jgi:hypothetical protein
MGRHSAPDETPDGADPGAEAGVEAGAAAGAAGAAGSVATVAAGRHVAAALELDAEHQTAPLRPLIADLGADAEYDDAPLDTEGDPDVEIHPDGANADADALTEAHPEVTPTTAFAVDTATATAETAETAAPPTTAKAPPREGGTHADLRLLRQQPGLRARCAAAVVVPFVLYTLAMLLLGRMDAYVLWVWIPTVVAGVSVGSFLDGAHRRDKRAASAEPATGPPVQQPIDEPIDKPTAPSTEPSVGANDGAG